jgi:hypothetical protein
LCGTLKFTLLVIHVFLIGVGLTPGHTVVDPLAVTILNLMKSRRKNCPSKRDREEKISAKGIQIQGIKKGKNEIKYCC